MWFCSHAKNPAHRPRDRGLKQSDKIMASHLSKASNHRTFDYILRNGGRYHFPISRRALAPVCVIQTGASAQRLIAACFTSESYCAPVPNDQRLPCERVTGGCLLGGVFRPVFFDFKCSSKALLLLQIILQNNG